MGSMEIWLSGPEHFFEHAKRSGILPWHDDDDDSPKYEPPKVSIPTPSPLVQHDAAPIVERSPYDPLPINWQTNPLKYGVSICVLEPTMSVGKILSHCKDCLDDNKIKKKCSV